MPNIMMAIASSLPYQYIGYRSPNPTVVIVTIVHQNDAGIDSNGFLDASAAVVEPQGSHPPSQAEVTMERLLLAWRRATTSDSGCRRPCRSRLNA